MRKYTNLWLAAIIVFAYSAGCRMSPTGEQEAADKAGEAKSDQAKPVPIRLRSQDPAIELAAKELVRYLDQMSGRGESAVVVDQRDRSAAIELGLFRDCGVSVKGLADPNRDDAIHIDVSGARGVIAGSNPRSVLFAAYRFLEACGCRWIRPGKNGDYVPSKPVDDLTVKLSEKAAYRFRGNNNAGAYSLDQILDKIEWMPKVGLNTFFSEFFLPQGMYRNYYERRYPSLRKPETRSDNELWAYHEKSIREIKRRGLCFHDVGHGWTGVVVGAPESQSDHWVRPAAPPGKEYLLALVNGKRDMSRGPTFTDLCYGNPEVRQLLVQRVADYAARHPEVDYLQVWTADGMNRTCECELCRDVRLSDWYVQTLNAVDVELTRRSIPTKIVFVLYNDLMWPPEKEQIANQDRFAMIFCPARLHDVPYDVTTMDLPEIPPYKGNQKKRMSDMRTIMAGLRGWQRMFRGEGFIFDYHLITQHFMDPGYYGFVEVMAEDIRRLPQLGMSGFVSCQLIRAYYPHGYPMYAHAKLLWNPKADTAELAREYFAGAFGEDGAQVRQYAERLSELFAPLYLDRETLWGKDGEGKQAALAKLAQIPEAIAAFKPVIASHLSTGDPAQRQSWKYLSSHSDFVLKLAAAVQTRAKAGKEAADVHWKALWQHMAEQEAETDAVFDIYWFVDRYQGYGLFSPLWKRQF